MNPAHAVDNSLIYMDLNQINSLFTDPACPIFLTQAGADGWSAGWRWHPSRQFDLNRLQLWLDSFDWRRAKLVVRTREGWFSTNSVDNSIEHWKSSEWRSDSRIELIFDQSQNLELLKPGLKKCLDVPADGKVG